MMGNNTVCQILGIGNVNLKLHDGIIRELSQVRYVPDQKRNLILLEMLNQIGCSVKIESSWMKIVKGSEVIKKSNTLQEN